MQTMFKDIKIRMRDRFKFKIEHKVHLTINKLNLKKLTITKVKMLESNFLNK